MNEFTGKQKDVYFVKVSVSVRRMVEHTTEGWIPLPGDRENVIDSATVREFDEQLHAVELYAALLDR